MIFSIFVVFSLLYGSCYRVEVMIDCVIVLISITVDVKICSILISLTFEMLSRVSCKIIKNQWRSMPFLTIVAKHNPCAHCTPLLLYMPMPAFGITFLYAYIIQYNTIVAVGTEFEFGGKFCDGSD